LALRLSRASPQADCDRLDGEGEKVMMNFKLIGAVIISLTLATPAMAIPRNYQNDCGRAIDEEQPVQDALKFGNGMDYWNYYSGYGDLSRNGPYRGNVCDDFPHLDLAPISPFN
jgi:hypothetical protein